MHHTVCIHVTCLATHCSANYPTLRGSGDNNYHQTLGADEVACMKWFSDPDSFLLCLRFALFVSFFFHIFFFPSCEIAHLDGRQMAQRAPKRAPTPTSHLAAVPPPPTPCSCAESKAPALPSPLFRSAFSPVSLPLRLAGTAATPAVTSQPGNDPNVAQFWANNSAILQR